MNLALWKYPSTRLAQSLIDFLVVIATVGCDQRANQRWRIAMQTRCDSEPHVLPPAKIF